MTPVLGGAIPQIVCLVVADTVYRTIRRTTRVVVSYIARRGILTAVPGAV
jgi:hypothetical protein